MRADQEKLLRERSEKLRQKLASRPNNSEEIEQELAAVEEKIKRAVRWFSSLPLV